ncbi:YhgE/Pip domain-containing protein [Companilactobacillus nodensis]|uniref:Integral membrane protein n=1 Tax=Companilactobacillus nodensis DSM 19682 = JCM 14932 = NBRC 107160 TaxID=1423775 RepID=A0A0R1KH29_9LACO|nr:YhgE/Pip domain-containing protein [Companilactobacillus nodensis]KRK79258.1 integral membrane protein [Companilactobacillus nodensis DSM 19682 = JCM 14932 = NBRC 107160]
MLKAEWKYILKHRFLLIVLIVIMFIPSIYSVTFLKSMWNPYQELNKIPVAVINEDEPVKYQDSELEVGHNLTNNLKNSSAMNFKIINNKKTADQGLKNGKYYMIITIPKNFSKNATTLMNKEPKKMILKYETSAGHNYTASKMTATAAKQVAQEVSQQITKSYSKTMFTDIKKIGNGMKTAANGSAKVVKGDQKISTANKTITNGLNQLAASSLTFSDGTNSLNQGLNDYIQGVDQLESGNNDLTSGVEQLSNNSSNLINGVGQLANGSSNLNTGIKSYTSGVDNLNSSTKSLNFGSSSLASGSNKLSKSSTALNSGMNQIYSASSQLSTQLQRVSDGLNSSSDTAKLSSSISNLKSALSNNSQSDTLQTDLASLQKSIDNNNDDLTVKVSDVADQQGLTSEQKSAILAAVSDNDSASITQAASTLNKDLSNMLDSQNTAVDNLNTIQSQLSTNSDLTTIIGQLSSGATALTTNIGTAATGMNQLNNGISQLTDNSTALANGANKVSVGTEQLADSSNTLTTGANTLTNGISSMNSQMPALTNGISQLDTGASQLNSGFHKLTANNQTLTSGSKQLSSGATQISSGANTLASGSSQMGTGISQVTSGDNTLATQLANGAKKAKVNPSKLTYDQIVQPATTKHTERDDAPNNGTGMAPYMLSVSLFVGALAFNMMFDTYSPRKYPRNGFNWWFSKASVQLVFATCEAIIVFGLLCVIDGLAPIHPVATFGMILCTALVFMAIVGWLNLVFGKVGAFFSMILLVLQLGGSAGTYPIQLSNGFFNAIHPWLPMSYSVSGLRETLMIGNSAISQMIILLSITTVFSIMSILFFLRRRSHINKIDFTKEAAENSLT